MLIFVQYLYGLTWAFSVAYARARLKACVLGRKERPRRTDYAQLCCAPQLRGKRKYCSVDTCNTRAKNHRFDERVIDRDISEEIIESCLSVKVAIKRTRDR